MIFPEGAPLTPPLPHRTRPEPISWVLVCLILIPWLGAEWAVRSSSLSAQTENTFRQHVEKEMLAYDACMRSGWHGPAWIFKYLRTDEVPKDMLWTHTVAEKNGLRADRFYLEFALICLRFHASHPDDGWQTDAEAALEKVTPPSKTSIYFKLVRKAVRGETLNGADRVELVDYCRQFPRDWWVAFMAGQLGMSEHIDQEGLQQREQVALGDFINYIWLNVTLMGLGLVSLPWAWKLLARPIPHTPSSTFRLYRLWPPSNVVGLFVLASLMALVLHSLFTWVLYPLITMQLRSSMAPYTAYWTGIWAWLGWSMAMSLLGAVLLCRTFAPGFRRLRQVLGFTRQDLTARRFLILGAAGMGIMPLLFSLLDQFLQFAGAPVNLLDSLSRSFNDLGSMSLPVSILWGAVLAPFVEELVFRGFMFRAMQQKWGTLVGMLVSSAIFAVGHFYSITGTIHVFIYGLIFAWVYQRTGKLASSMILHGANNLALALMGYFAGG